MSHIVILATGGTIAGNSANPLDTANYQAGAVGIETILKSLPYADAAWEGIDFAAIPSEDATIAFWQRLGVAVQQAAERPEVDGIVVTMGTDTLEECAYFLHLTVQTTKPVVLVGAMRPATALSADGPGNLMQAILVAQHPAAQGQGVLVVMNDTIFSAREVTKQDSFRMNAFSGREFGVLGYVLGQEVAFYQKTTRRHTINSQFAIKEIGEMNLLPKVDIQMMYAGYEPKLLLAAKEYGAEAVVLAGFGNGTMSKETLAVQRSLAAAGMIFVAASRTGNGVVSKIYPDMILAGNLTPQKARVLCMLALTQTKQPAELQEIFAQY